MENEKKRNERKPRRTRTMIRKDIFDAVSNIVKNEGFSKLSISQIAETADMESIVIYRNFNNIENILEQYIERFDFWLSFFAKDDNKDIEASKENYQESLSELLEMVHKKKEIRQLLVWELAEDTPFTSTLAQRKENTSEGFFNKYVDMFKDSDMDIRMVSAIFISSIYFLSMYKNRAPFCGVDMGGKDGRSNLNKTLIQLIDLIFNKFNKTEEKAIAKKMLDENIPMETVMRVTGLTEAEIKEEPKVLSTEPSVE